MGLPCFNALTALLHQSLWNMTMARYLSLILILSIAFCTHLLLLATSVLLALSNLACMQIWCELIACTCL